MPRSAMVGAQVCRDVRTPLPHAFSSTASKTGAHVWWLRNSCAIN